VEMRRVSIPVRFLGAVPGMVVFLALVSLAQIRTKETQAPGAGVAKATPQASKIPPCNGAPSGSSAERLPAAGNSHPHSVTLSWNAALPVSNSSLDLIKGYYVYRSLVSHTYTEANRITASPLAGTQCVDTSVEPRKTYFYVVRAVTDGGMQSGSSIEIKAVVPFP
jgi:hypothetical protein